jgi:hypothetical protein
MRLRPFGPSPVSRTVSLAVGCLCALLTSPTFAQEPTSEPIVLRDRLVSSDAPDRLRKVPAKTHVVELKKGKIYRIDMASTEIDSSLRIENEAGKTLAQDEDGGGGLNARISFRPPEDGRYRIQATTYAGDVGSYTLTIHEVEPPIKMGPPKLPVRGGPMPEAVKVSLPADKKPLVLKESLKADDARDPVMGQPTRIYEVELEADQVYRIDLKSRHFDSFLRLVDEKNKELARDDDSGGDLNARILFRPKVRGSYRIVATTLKGQVGNYVFSIAPQARPEKFVAGKVRKIAAGQMAIEGELAADDTRDAVRRNSVCQIHQIEMSPAKSYVIELASSRFDAYLRLESADGKQLAEDDDSGGGTNARIRFRPRMAGTYRIIATTFDGGMFGTYTLTIREE